MMAMIEATTTVDLGDAIPQDVEQIQIETPEER